MQRFVEDQQRRSELAQTLGFRLGGGRGRVLFQLRDGPMTLKEIAQRNSVDAPYATVIVDRLERHGLVERRPHPEDRRRKLVVLTAAGQAALDVADAILLRPPAAMSALDAHEVSQLVAALTRLVGDTDAGRSHTPVHPSTA